MDGNTEVKDVKRDEDTKGKEANRHHHTVVEIQAALFSARIEQKPPAKEGKEGGQPVTLRLANDTQARPGARTHLRFRNGVVSSEIAHSM